VLDEYASPSEHATAGHLDFDATDFSATVGIEQLKAKAKNLQTEAGREVYKAILKLYEDAAALVKELAEAKGDSSEQQKAEIKQKYDEMIAKFTINKMPDAAANAAKVRDYEMLKIDAAQTQQSLGYGTSDLKMLVLMAQNGIRLYSVLL
jgi:cellobiose phosphorylase